MNFFFHLMSELIRAAYTNIEIGIINKVWMI